IDQSLCASAASGMVPDAAGCCMLCGADCWLADTGPPNELVRISVPGRSAIPANPGNPPVGLLLEEPPGILLRENSAPGGSGTPDGRRFALLPDALRKFAGSGGTMLLARVISTGGVAARLNMPRR